LNRVLLRLMWVESRAIVRLALRGLGSVRGALTALAGVVLMAGVPYAASLSVTRAGNFVATIKFMRDWAPEGFFLMVALGALAPRGLFYRPAELALLFPAPIPRRQLVLYNIVWRARISVLSALWLSYLGVLGGRPVAVALVGYTLILLLLQISSQWFAVLRARLSAQQAAIALATAGCACATVAWIRGPLELLHSLAWLTRPALEAVSADTLAHAAPWACVTALTIAFLGAGTCLMDSDYHATALARSLERKKRRRVRGGAGAYGPSVRSAWLRVPAFPHLRGAGPIAWRQCVELARNPRRIGPRVGGRRGLGAGRSRRSSTRSRKRPHDDVAIDARVDRDRRAGGDSALERRQPGLRLPSRPRSHGDPEVVPGIGGGAVGRTGRPCGGIRDGRANGGHVRRGSDYRQHLVRRRDHGGSRRRCR
jgi:hypothetical protein